RHYTPTLLLQNYILLVSLNPTTSEDPRSSPKDLPPRPLDVTHVTATLAPTRDAPPTLLTGRALTAPDRIADSRFASLIGRGHLSALVVLASLALAVFWGAAHALSPGHGKTIVTA